MRKLYLTVLALSLIVTMNSCTSKPENVSSSNNNPTNSTQINEASEKELTSSDLERKISDLQSQIDEIKGNTSSVESSIPEIDIDLKVLADKIIAECPPPDGVELVYDTENIEEVFNNFLDRDKEDEKFMKKYYIDTSKVKSFIRVTSTNPDQYLYTFVLARINIDENIKSFQISANASTKKYIKPYIQVINEHPSGNMNSYIYNIVLSNIVDDPQNSKAEQIVIQTLS